MIRVAKLTSSQITFTVFAGSDDLGFSKEALNAELILKRNISEFSDPVFRRPSKMRKQKWATRHCRHGKLDGYISVNNLEGDWFIGFDEFGNPIAAYGAYVLIPLSARFSAFAYVTDSTGRKTIVPDTRGEGFVCARSDPSETSGSRKVRIAISQRFDAERGRGYAMDVDINYDDATLSLGRMLETWEGSWNDCIVRTRKFLADPAQPGGEPYAFTPWQHYAITATPFDVNDALIGAINSGLDRLWRNVNTDVDANFEFDDELFAECAENFRPDVLSYLETYVGLKEMPTAIQTVVSAVTRLFGRKAKKAVTFRALIGCYLIWCYVVKPAPHDVNIVRRWFKDVLSPYRFSNARMYARKQFTKYSTDLVGTRWYGYYQACVQLWPLDGKYVPETNDYLDAVEKDHPLRVADGYGYRFNSVDPSVFVPMLKDLFPLDVGAIAEQFWNAIAYSFVVDWFIPVGTWGHRYSVTEYYRTLPVEWACRTTSAVRDASEYAKELLEFSIRFETGVSPALTASVFQSFYRRSYRKTVPEIKIFLTQSIRPSSWWLQGAALILQRTLK